MARGTFSSTFGSGLQGGATGASVGSAFGVPGALTGLGVGSALGAAGGYFASQADAPMDEAQLEQMLMANKISKLQYRQMMEELREKQRIKQNQKNLGAKVAERLRASGAGATFSNTFGGQNG